MLDEVAGLQLRHRLSKFLLRVHNVGPYHATGSSIGLPETSKNRMPSLPD
jgi:hypothetical protein